MDPMTNVGLPAIVPPSVLKKVRSLFTDDDTVVNNGIEWLQQAEQVFENAKAYLCGYHIVRNFHAEFGIGCKQKFGLKASSTKYRKGGDINWGHPWQQRCADAIYRLQVCESEDEVQACFRWIKNFIKTNDKRHCPGIASQAFVAVLSSKIQKEDAVDSCISYVQTHARFEINVKS